MKFSLALISSLVACCSAAPAVVWKKNSQQRFLHSADDVAPSEVLGQALVDSSLSVIFLVNKGADGSESLTKLASSGQLPATAQKYSDAQGVYHHVSGLESEAVMVREASSLTEQNVLTVSMTELNQKLNGSIEEVDENGDVVVSTNKKIARRARQLAAASVLVVSVDPKIDASVIDQTLSNTIDNAKVDSVVLAGIRSIDEVKRERALAAQRKRHLMEEAGKQMMEARRRRLEQAAGDDAAQDNVNDDMSGVFYVAMTPNMLAGMMAFGLFSVVTWIGITCMGAISGQDVYVSKMPSVGREA